MSKEKDAIIARLREMQSLLETEKRGFTADEKSEFDALSAKLKDNKQERQMNRKFDDVEKYLRECSASKKNDTITMARTQNGLLIASEATAITPVEIEDVKDLFPQSIFDKVGIELQYDVQGDVYWPYVSADAQVYFGVAEGTALTDSELVVSKSNVAPERMGVSTPVSNLALARTAGIAENVTMKHLPRLFGAAIDKVLFSLAKVSGFTNVQGPLVDLTPTVAGATSATFAQLSDLKGQLLGEGVDEQYACWVMTPATKAALEATPTDAGSGIMCIVNDKLLGLPVYTTPYIKDASNVEYIAIGDWSYCPTYFTGGPLAVVVDPITGLKKAQTEFVMQSHISVNPILPSKAFKLLKLANA